jgi:hypothetical protein
MTIILNHTIVHHATRRPLPSFSRTFSVWTSTSHRFVSETLTLLFDEDTSFEVTTMPST